MLLLKLLALLFVFKLCLVKTKVEEGLFRLICYAPVYFYSVLVE